MNVIGVRYPGVYLIQRHEKNDKAIYSNAGCQPAGTLTGVAFGVPGILPTVPTNWQMAWAPYQTGGVVSDPVAVLHPGNLFLSDLTDETGAPTGDPLYDHDDQPAG